MATVVPLKMQAGKLLGIVSDSEARGLETRRNGDLPGDGGVRLRIQKVDGKEEMVLRALSTSPLLCTPGECLEAEGRP